MEKLSEKLTNYSIYNVIEEHCSDLQELYTKEKECMHQPISRYESDFVSISSLKEISTTFRNDYIKDADDYYENDETLILRIPAPAVVEKNDCGTGNNLVDEMRLHFSNGDQNMKLSDTDLLNKLDNYLDKLYRSRRGCGELLKSVPSSTYTSFKEKLTKKSDLASSLGISLNDSNVKLEMKEPERKRGGGFKRKLVRESLEICCY
jgi:hypothetical protein